MNITDKKARQAVNRKLKESGYLLPLFVSRSAAITEVETMALKNWNDFLDRLEDKDEKIFQPQGGFLPFAEKRKGSTFMRLRPAKWFKSITRKHMSQLTHISECPHYLFDRKKCQKVPKSRNKYGKRMISG